MSNIFEDLGKIPEVITDLLSGKTTEKKQSKYSLPEPVSLRKLEFGNHVADYASHVLWKRKGGNIHMGCFSTISVFVASVITYLNYFAMSSGYGVLAATATCIILPLLFNSTITTIMKFKYPPIENKHLPKMDIIKKLNYERRNELEKLRIVNLPRLKLTVSAVNTYNKMVKEAEVTLRTLELRDKPVNEMADKLRNKLQLKRDSLKKMLNIFGSLVEGETRDIILEETGKTLLLTSIESDEQFSDIDAYISSTIQVLETDIKTLDNFDNLDSLGIEE